MGENKKPYLRIIALPILAAFIFMVQAQAAYVDSLRPTAARQRTDVAKVLESEIAGKQIDHLSEDQLASFRNAIAEAARKGESPSIAQLIEVLPKGPESAHLKNALNTLSSEVGADRDEIIKEYNLNEAEQVAFVPVIQPGQGMGTGKTESDKTVPRKTEEVDYAKVIKAVKGEGPKTVRDYTRIKRIERLPIFLDQMTSPQLPISLGDGNFAVLDSDNSVTIIDSEGNEIRKIKIKLTGLDDQYSQPQDLAPAEDETAREPDFLNDQYSQLQGLAPAGDGTAWMSDTKNNTLIKVDLKNGTIVGGINQVGSSPQGLALSRDETAVVSNRDNSLSIVGLKAGKVIERISDVGLNNPGNPVLVKKDVVAVVNFGDNSISIIDLKEDREINKIMNVGLSLSDIALREDGNLVAASGFDGLVYLVEFSESLHECLLEMLGKRNVIRVGNASEAEADEALALLGKKATEDPFLVWALVNGLHPRARKAADFRLLDKRDLSLEQIEALDGKKIGNMTFIVVDTEKLGADPEAIINSLKDAGVTEVNARFMVSRNSALSRNPKIAQLGIADIYQPNTLQILIESIIAALELPAETLNANLKELKRQTKSLKFV